MEEPKKTVEWMELDESYKWNQTEQAIFRINQTISQNNAILGILADQDLVRGMDLFDEQKRIRLVVHNEILMAQRDGLKRFRQRQLAQLEIGFRVVTQKWMDYDPTEADESDDEPDEVFNEFDVPPPPMVIA